MNRRKILKSLGATSIALGGASMLANCTKNDTCSTSSGAASPGIQKGKYKIKMATTWLKNLPGFGTGANHLGKMIETLSDGEIEVKVYGAGEVVPAMGVFDAVQQGTVQMGHGASYYWQGKVPAAPFFATVPFGFTASEMNAWLDHGGGQQIWDEAYAPFGVKAFTVGNSGVQMGGWYKKEIDSLNDFKGLKIRMPGLGGKVLSQVGAAVVTMSGGEVFQSLKSGAIDAAEWVGPYNDIASGLYKAAKFYYWPGWHEPGSNIELSINKEFFDSLPERLQKVIEVSCRAANQAMISEYTARNAPALKALTGKHGVKLKKFPDEVLKELKKVSEEVVSDIAKSDKIAAKAYDSMRKFRGEVLSWQKISEVGYSLARGFNS